MSVPPALIRRLLIRLRGPAARRRVRLPIATVLVGGFGFLLVLAVTSVLVLGLITASSNTYTLLNDKADLALRGVEARARNQLDPAQAMATFLAGLMERGEIDPDDRGRLIDTMRGALAAVPNVSGVGFITPDLGGVRVSRQNGDLVVAPVTLGEYKPQLRDRPLDAARMAPSWVGPVWSAEMKTTVVLRVHPVRVAGRHVGDIAVGVTLGDLSRFLSALFVEQGINAFVLYDKTHVLAHPTLAARSFDFSGARSDPPLPTLDQVDDPALAVLWKDGIPLDGFTFRVQGIRVNLTGEAHLFLLRQMPGYGAQDWTLGISFPERDVDREIRRLSLSAAVGVVILIVSVAVGLFIGRRISRQVGLLAEAADRIRAFDFQNVRELPDSRLRELARAAAAFNSMVAGLRWFETYVPKSLVLRLMRRRGDSMDFASEERMVTVMFTDIRGFSRLAERLAAADTATLLNEHFTQLAACIEAEGGTVDKFIGDAIMAFWGAPDEQADHAARALRAARAIACAVHADNRRRSAGGQPPVRVRIGLHSGPVVVGNIGSANRINYTIVGDTVNVAARIEELASGLQGTAEVIVLASGVTADLSDGAESLTRLGPQPLRGRTAPCEVWQLDLDAGLDIGGSYAGDDAAPETSPVPLPHI